MGRNHFGAVQGKEKNYTPHPYPSTNAFKPALIAIKFSLSFNVSPTTSCDR